VFSSHPILKHALADYNEDAKKDGLPAYTVEDLRRKDAYTAVVGSIGSKHVYLAYAEDPHGTPQHDIKETQVFMLASSMGILVAHQNPLDMLICIGSMTKDWKILFEPVTALLQRNPGGRFYLPELKPPTIVRNTFENVAIIGAAAYLLAKQNVLEKK
jgi:hypothetical protein